MQKAMIALSVLALLTNSAPATASPCRDAKGKFIKCPAKAVPTRCKDAKGRFAKCGTRGAKPS
jgi:hypothetical protein